MARTVNHAIRAVRRDAFMETAQKLVISRGYENFGVQDVIDALGASKGAFYHYFDSKQALLAAVIDSMTDAVLVEVQPILDDPARSAPDKLATMFQVIARWKQERSELIRGFMDVWFSDANTVVREQLRTSVSARITPVIAELLRQGEAEGSIQGHDPDHTAVVFVALMLAAGDTAGRLFLTGAAGTAELDEVQRTLSAFGTAYERVLGVPAGSFPMIDRETLEFWFQPAATTAASERESAA
jgi:AcrR family transcriptional regulator